MSSEIPVGLLLGSMISPEQIASTAKLGEELGFDELWLAEDYFYTGGISAVTAALDATERIPVGTGIVAAPVRHPAVLAMEIATIARIHPGRFWPGIALGLPDWLRQMGLHPTSTLSAVRECVEAVKALTGGQEVTQEGNTFTFDRVKLAHPVSERLPIYMGAVAPKMLCMAGALADGVILPLFAGTHYIEWAAEQIAAGRAEAGRSDPCRLVVFSFFSVADTDAEAKAAARTLFATYLHLSAGMTPMFDAPGITAELAALGADGAAGVDRDMPESWIDDLAVVGDPSTCATRIQRLRNAGVDSVVLFPMPHERAEQIVTHAARDVLPRLS